LFIATTLDGYKDPSAHANNLTFQEAGSLNTPDQASRKVDRRYLKGIGAWVPKKRDARNVVGEVRPPEFPAKPEGYY
jgi:hypothetical protein